MNERMFKTRPYEMEGQTEAVETPVGTAYITINKHEGAPAEVIVALGKTGSTERSLVEAIGRVCSTALQHGTPLVALCRQLRGISSEHAMGLGDNKVLSVPDALGKVMESYIREQPLDRL